MIDLEAPPPEGVYSLVEAVPPSERSLPFPTFPHVPWSLTTKTLGLRAWQKCQRGRLDRKLSPPPGRRKGEKQETAWIPGVSKSSGDLGGPRAKQELLMVTFRGSWPPASSCDFGRYRSRFGIVYNNNDNSF